MLTDLRAFFNARGAGDGVIEIASEFSAYRIALHWRPSFAEDDRSGINSGDREAVNLSFDIEATASCDETIEWRAAEKASEKGLGCDSATAP